MWIYQAILLAVTLTAAVNPHPHPDGLQTYAPGHDNYKPTDYSFSYGVKDYHSGDIKHQWEKKNGDKVIGHYSLVEPDGSIRSVDYSADDHNGFNAVVKHTGTFKHPVPHHFDTKDEPTSHNELILKQKLEEPIPQQHSYKQSWQQQEEPNYQTEDENFVYVNKEELAQESQHSAIKSNHRYRPQNQNALRSQSKIKEEYGDVKLAPELPIDLSLIKEHPVQPVDVSIVDPVEITLRSNKYSSKDTSMQPSHELSEEEILKYLEHYYQQNNVPSEPYIEGGFVPIKNKPKELITQPNIPGTFTSNKKPKTTPGLSTFTSKGNRPTRRNPKSNRNYLKKPLPQFHYYVPVVETVDENLYGSLANSGLGRYAKYLNYQN